MSPQLLEGIKVLSLAEQYPGPYATLLLADLGADVTLVERPSGGDPSRQFPAFFDALNRNKRSIALDLKSRAGLDAFKHVAARADVLLEGFRPGTMARLGVGPEDLRSINPGLVYVSISGFGQTGPYRDLPAHDPTYQGIAGLLYERIRGPDVGAAPSVMVGDLSAGMFAAIAVLVGLVDRARRGKGRHFDVSMTDGLVSWMSTHLLPPLNGLGPGGLPPEPAFGVFRAGDGRMLTLSISHEDRFWHALCEELGLDALAPLQAPARQHRAEELRQAIAARLRERPRDEWLARLTAVDVPAGPVHDLDDVLADPHVAERGLVVDGAPRDGVAPRRYLRQPIVIEGYHTRLVRPTPELGEHTREVLEEAGVDPEIIEVAVNGDRRVRS